MDKNCVATSRRFASEAMAVKKIFAFYAFSVDNLLKREIDKVRDGDVGTGLFEDFIRERGCEAHTISP